MSASLLAADSVGVYAGRPGRYKKRTVSSSGSHTGFLEDWHKVVKNLSVSSKEAQASRLIDGTGGFWQSSGAQGKVSRRRTLLMCENAAGSGYVGTREDSFQNQGL